MPLSGEVDCEVLGYTKRIDSSCFGESEAETWGRRKGERSIDTCVFPDSLMFTGDGARAQFIYGWGIRAFEEGNEYGDSWVDVNCERMESRSTTSAWSYALNRPKQGYDAENMKWFKQYLPEGSVYWRGSSKRAWMPWEVITSISDTEKWLCRQYEDREQGRSQHSVKGSP